MQFNSPTLSWIIRIVFHEQRSAVALSSLLFAHWSTFCCSQQTSSEMSINEAHWALPYNQSHSRWLCTKHFFETSLNMLVVRNPSDSAVAAKTKQKNAADQTEDATWKKKSHWALHHNYLQKPRALYQFIFCHRSPVNPSLVNYEKRKTKQRNIK